MVEQQSSHRGAGGVWIEALWRLGALNDDVLQFPGWDRLTRRATANDALVCPKSRCGVVIVDIEPPVFGLPAHELLARINRIALAEPRTVQTKTEQPDGRSEFRQASAVFRFPDIVNVEVFAVSPNESTLAIWSRSVVGRKDFGVNRARVERWLSKLRAGAPGP